MDYHRNARTNIGKAWKLRVLKAPALKAKKKARLASNYSKTQSFSLIPAAADCCFCVCLFYRSSDQEVKNVVEKLKTVNFETYFQEPR